MATMSANSPMRTKPASTIGEIGFGAGLAATAIASVVRRRFFRDGARLLRMPPATAAALEAFSDGRVSKSLIAMPQTGPAGVAMRLGNAPNSRKLLRNKSQQRLIRLPEKVLMPALLP